MFTVYLNFKCCMNAYITQAMFSSVYFMLRCYISIVQWTVGRKYTQQSTSSIRKALIIYAQMHIIQYICCLTCLVTNEQGGMNSRLGRSGQTRHMTKAKTICLPIHNPLEEI